MGAPFDPTAVSSLAEVLAEHTGALTFVPPAHLPLWLPDLTVPQGWAAAGVDGATVTRMLLRRLGSGDHWDGCEVLNLYRVPGTVPEPLVLDNADRALRDSGADDIRTYRVDTPPRYAVIATRASGTLRIGTRTVPSQYNYYVVNTAAGGALIEQAMPAGQHRPRPDTAQSARDRGRRRWAGRRRPAPRTRGTVTDTHLIGTLGNRP